MNKNKYSLCRLGITHCLSRANIPFHARQNSVSSLRRSPAQVAAIAVNQQLAFLRHSTICRKFVDLKKLCSPLIANRLRDIPCDFVSMKRKFRWSKRNSKSVSTDWNKALNQSRAATYSARSMCQMPQGCCRSAYCYSGVLF